MPDTPGIGEQILGWLWDRRDVVLQKLKDIAAWFRGEKDRPGILILGPGGAGKTTFGKILAGEYDRFWDAPGAYEESIQIERYALQDQPNVEIVVPPGQEHRRGGTWEQLHADLSAGKFRGVILLASYGYHTLGLYSYKDHRIYKAKGHKDTFLEAYLQENRAEEVEVLRQLIPHLKVNKGKVWLLTLVSKQDLWWPDRDEVEKHYREGAYGAQIQDLQAHLGQHHFRHEFAFASLVISNFNTGVGERLAENVGGYDHPLQVKSLRRLFEVVEALKNWETGK